MPPSTNFYIQERLFEIFAQHIPSNSSTLSPLDYLHQHNGKHLGALSFANPDNPMVKAPQRIPSKNMRHISLPNLQAGEHVLVSTQTSKPFADTMVYHQSKLPLAQALQGIKNQADPQNRLQALRWAQQIEHSEQLLWHPRPDVDFYRQQLLGCEHIRSLLNLSSDQYAALTQHGNKFSQIHQEVIRTYCKNTAVEIQMLEHMLPLLLSGQISAHLIYGEGKRQPTVLGMQYLLA